MRPRDRLVSRSAMPGPFACWTYLGGRDKDGYGIISIANRSRRAHRVAFEVWIGKIPDSLCVLHSCDNPPCVNPAHLFLGTDLDNARDRDAKGRGASGDRSGARLHPERLARGDRHGARLHPESVLRGYDHPSRCRPWTRPRGEKNGRSKLTHEKVAEIRARYASGEIRAALAHKFGVSWQVVNDIVRMKKWIGGRA